MEELLEAVVDNKDEAVADEDNEDDPSDWQNSFEYYACCIQLLCTVL